MSSDCNNPFSHSFDILIDKLIPFFLLRELFSYRLVCKQWNYRISIFIKYNLKSLSFCDESLDHILKKHLLIFIIRHSINVQFLQLSGCWRAVDHESLSIISFCSNKLKCIDLSNCGGVEFFGIRSLTLHCQNLMEINLNNCFNVDEASLLSIAHGCSKLENLYIRSCYGATDISILTILQKCQLLKELDVGNCYNLSPLITTFIFGMEDCSLVLLRVTGCSKIVCSLSLSQLLTIKNIAVNFFY